MFTNFMSMLLSQRIALDPNNKQATYLRRAAGVARFAYNWALSEWDRERSKGGKPNWPALSRKLNAIKREQFPWMMEVTSWAPSNSVQNLGTAFQKYFRKKAQRPRFKKKGVHDSFETHPRVTNVKGRSVFVPNLGTVRMRQELRYSGKIKQTVFSCIGGRWFLSVTIDTDFTFPQSENQAAVGVDLGVKALATLSDGTVIEGPKPHRALSMRLRRLNKSLHRKVKGSKNRNKAKRKISRLHARIGNIRLDALHKLTHQLTSQHGAIGIESLNVSGMVRNRSLSRAISDMGFFEFKRQLLYKAAWRGVRVFEADRFFPSSKTCSACGLVRESLPLDIRAWVCECGAQHDRDVNAAINLRNMAAGLAVSACGDSSSGGGPVAAVKLPSVKQESTNRKG